MAHSRLVRMVIDRMHSLVAEMHNHVQTGNTEGMHKSIDDTRRALGSIESEVFDGDKLRDSLSNEGFANAEAAMKSAANDKETIPQEDEWKDPFAASRDVEHAQPDANPVDVVDNTIVKSEPAPAVDASHHPV